MVYVPDKQKAPLMPCSDKRARLWMNGLPRGYLIGSRAVRLFEIGDMANAVVRKGNKQGTYPARVAVRASGSFNLQTASRVVEGISPKHCRRLQRGDGFSCRLVSAVQDLIRKEGASAPA
jgi:hypothetical protein